MNDPLTDLVPRLGGLPGPTVYHDRRQAIGGGLSPRADDADVPRYFNDQSCRLVVFAVMHDLVNGATPCLASLREDLQRNEDHWKEILAIAARDTESFDGVYGDLARHLGATLDASERQFAAGKDHITDIAPPGQHRTMLIVDSSLLEAGQGA
jgi:hypothetical protein